MKKPRPFNHKPIFLDARQEQLHARQEQLHALSGTFSSKRQQQKGGETRLSIPMLLSLLLILAATALVLLYST